ncbi:unnamed protein product [Prorocentrum cordatum]|uniref:Uncharacterized protein n=1 Tax=Prorocentrum cordatum TaxID=2364126 RepID=A0ABN9QSM1_9DINO|nr:unnamed protein product [Polarella glacialis]
MYRAADGPQQVQVPWPPSRPPPGVFGVRVRQRASEAQSWCAEVDSHAHVRTVRLSLQERPDETYWALADDAAGLEQFLRQGARGLKVSLKLGALQLLGHGALGSVLRAAAQSGASVTHLDLSSNGLGDDVAEEIARFAECQDDVSLSELQLANNRISALGLAQICAALAGRQAGEGSAGGAATLRLPGPCWLDLRGNAVDRPREVARCLDELGVPTCPGARCCRQRCLVSAPVHLAGGLVPQRAARRWRSEELAEALQQISQRPPPPRVPRPPLGLEKRVPPPPSEDRAGVAAQLAEWTVEECLHLRPRALSPLGLPDVPPISEGQIIQVQQSTWAGPQGHLGAAAGVMLKVLRVSPLELWTSERVQAASAAVTGEGGTRAFLVSVREIAATPALQ